MAVGKAEWEMITTAHVKEAVNRYNENPQQYSRARNTFLIYNNKEYPAKAIRGIAYDVCFGQKINQSEFTGGVETARFFQRLGFAITSDGSKPMVEPRPDLAPIDIKNINPAAQKNALHSLLQKHFGIVVSEKRFEWLQVPLITDFDDTYTRIYDSLCEYRQHREFIREGRCLLIDFYIESLNLVIEYDENQHFSRARYLTLECYPPNLDAGFPVAEWMETCSSMNAVDNHPANRDETRAFYDSVRDIEIPRHGIRFLRIRHKAVNWEGSDADIKLIELLKPYLPVSDPLRVINGPQTNPVEPRTEKGRDIMSKSLPKVINGPQTNPVEPDWRALEISFQRIKLNYLKWFFHFTPPEAEIIPGCGFGNDYRLLESDYGRSFTAFPCGLGSVYAGGGKGCVGLPKTCFDSIPELIEETQYLKDAIAEQTKTVKMRILQTLDRNDIQETWRMLLEYWWIKLGFHEYAHDVAYQVGRDSEPIKTSDIRDYLLITMYRSLTVESLDAGRFNAVDIKRFIQYGTQWNRFACCAFDCGPIAIGKNGFVPYEQAASARRKYFAEHDANEATDEEKRVMAREALKSEYDFLMLYYDEPLSLMCQYSGFIEQRNTLRCLIDDTQQKLNAVIMQENLCLPILNYLPI